MDAGYKCIANEDLKDTENVCTFAIEYRSTYVRINTAYHPSPLTAYYFNVLSHLCRLVSRSVATVEQLQRRCCVSVHLQATVVNMYVVQMWLNICQLENAA